jgi:hypothetical protein
VRVIFGGKESVPLPEIRRVIVDRIHDKRTTTYQLGRSDRTGQSMSEQPRTDTLARPPVIGRQLTE